MEEVIKEIKMAEEAAKKVVSDAEREAAEIIAAVDGEIEALKSEYDEKFKTESAAVLNLTKTKINKLYEAESESAASKANKIKIDAGNKIKSCADMVYDFIIKEFTE